MNNRLLLVRWSLLVLILMMGLNGFAQTKFAIKGIVTDEKNTPLTGATVLEAGTQNGSITDAEGKFEFNASKKDIYVDVSYVGYKDQSSEVSSGKENVIVLSDANVVVEDVVVMGYGNTSSKDVSSSISSLSEKEFNKGPMTSVAQMIQGKVAGVYVTKDGDPNGGGNITIRGTSTLNGSQSPLYVIDGVPGGGSVAPEDIVSIDVLKDASATAIYGSKAANGVIMITTRQSRGGNQKYSTFNAYTSIESVSNRIEMLSGEQYRDYMNSNSLSIDDGWDDGSSTDWQRELTRKALTQNYYFNMGGSQNKTRYDASFNYLSQDGVVKTTGQEKLTLRASVDQTMLKDKLTVGLTLNSTISKQQMFPSYDRLYQSMFTFLPTNDGYKEDGSYLEDMDKRDPNPLELLNESHQNIKNKNIFGSLRISYDIFKDLKFNAIASYTNTQSNMGRYDTKYSYIRGRNEKPTGNAVRSFYEGEEKLLEAFFNYNKELKSHKLNFMAGYSWQENTSGDGLNATTRNFMSDATGYYNFNLATPDPGFDHFQDSQSFSTLRLISFYGRINYSFKNKYIFQASLRGDGSSAFGANNRWGAFPSVSGAWRITGEKFMAGQKVFSDLKLKAGYGISGNSSGFNPMTSRLRYGKLGNYYYDNAYKTGVGVVQNENPNLKWEKTAMFNIGIDASLFDSRLHVILEYYDKQTTDLIWNYSVPTEKYLHNTITANAGEVRNNGVELTINADIVRKRAVNWSTGITLSHNKNNVVSLSNEIFSVDQVYTGGEALGPGQTGGSVQLIKEGYPLGTFYTFKWAGYDENGQSQFYDKNGDLTTGPKAQDDYYFCGNSQPKLSYSWSNNISYKGFSLDVLFRGVAGHTVFNGTLARLNYSSRAMHYNQPKVMVDEGQPFGDQTSLNGSDRFLERADFFRLENVNLSYLFQFPQSKYVKDLSLYFNVTNAFVLTGYRGIDPEISMSGIQPGLDAFNFYPKTRTFQIGAKISF